MLNHFANRRAFLTSLATATVAVSFPRTAATAWSPSMSGLNNHLALQGRYFGTAVRLDQLKEMPTLRRAVLSNCGSLTPELDLKWAAIEWNRGEYNFQPVDDLIEFADKNGMQVHGHTLLWGQSVPPWAMSYMAENAGDWSIISTYMSAVLGRFGDRISRWDLVNEAVDTAESDSLRRNVFYKTFGPNYIERALSEARAHAPNAKFLLNEYSLEYNNQVDEARRHAVLHLLERSKRSGSGFDGLGIQAHLDLSKGNVQRRIIKPFLEEVANLGLDIFISELDMQEADLSRPKTVRDQMVSEEVRRYLDIVLEIPNVKGVTTWGVSDDLSWLNSDEYKRRDVKGASFAKNRGLPFDDAMRPKDLYFAMNSAFSERRVG